MKLSVIFLFGVVLALSSMAKASISAECVASIDAAQACAKTCGESPTSGDNLLKDCMESDSESMIDCCLFSGTTCESTWSSAKTCVDENLVNVKTTAEAYFDCLFSKDVNNVAKCPFGGWCVNQFSGGYGEKNLDGTANAANNFAVGDSTEASSLAQQTRVAQTCEDTNFLGYNFCDVLGSCCNACKDTIANFANAIMDDLLLPTYGTNGLSGCSKNAAGNDKTCDADYLVSRRLLETEEVSLAGPFTLSAENAAVAGMLALECNDGLNNDLIVHNETYAISNYLDCVYKKSGKAAAELEDSKAAESSSISLSFGPTAALSVIASALYAIVVA